MATTVILPKQGQSVETCIITDWYKKPGDKVEKGDLLFAYETDKASFEEEAAADGTLLEIFFQSGEEVPVLSGVAVIGEPGEAFDRPGAGDAGTESGKDEPPGDEAEGKGQVETGEGAGSREEKPSESREKTRISPRARKLAAEKGIPVDRLQGSGPGGRIIVRDVEAMAAGVEPEAAKPPPAGVKQPPAKAAVPEPAAGPPDRVSGPVPSSPPAGDSEDIPLSNIRRLIAGAMHASLQNSAQLTHHLSADARKILSIRSRVKKMQSEESYAYNITLNDMVCYAVVRALKSHPDANVHFLGDSIRRFRKVHLGMAVDTERGLMVPVLRNADDYSLAGLSEQLKGLAQACHSGKIDPDLLQPDAASFTVSNLGNYGVEMFTPVVNLPQAGILGVNTIMERPARMEDGTFGFVPYIGLSLTYDHRALDGGPATLFLAGIKKEIEDFDQDLLKQ